MTRRAAYVDSVRDLSDGALRCHAWGHPWEPGPVRRQCPVGLEVWVVKLTCPSCGKKRTDQVEPGTYALWDRHYTDPDGYRVIEPTDLAGYREESIRRAMARQLVPA